MLVRLLTPWGLLKMLSVTSNILKPKKLKILKSLLWTSNYWLFNGWLKFLTNCLQNFTAGTLALIFLFFMNVNSIWHCVLFNMKDIWKIILHSRRLCHKSYPLNATINEPAKSLAKQVKIWAFHKNTFYKVELLHFQKRKKRWRFRFASLFCSSTARGIRDSSPPAIPGWLLLFPCATPFIHVLHQKAWKAMLLLQWNAKAKLNNTKWFYETKFLAFSQL